MRIGKLYGYYRRREDVGRKQRKGEEVMVSGRQEPESSVKSRHRGPNGMAVTFDRGTNPKYAYHDGITAH